MDDLSMRGVRQLDLVDGDDVHGSTTAFQDCASSVLMSLSMFIGMADCVKVLTASLVW